MNKTTKYLLLILAGSVIFFLGRGCKNPDPHHTPPLINSDSIAQLGYKKGYEIAKLEEIGKVKQETAKVKTSNWNAFKAKTDTIRDTIFRQAVSVCDTALAAKDDYICHLETISAHKDTAITYWRSAYRWDSTNNRTKDKVIADTVKYFGKRVRRGYFKGFLHGFTAGNVTGAMGQSLMKK